MAKNETAFTIGGRTYELVSFYKKGEKYVSGFTMEKRAMDINANLGEKDYIFILKHQDEIPQKFRGKFYLVFLDSWGPLCPRQVQCLFWNDCRWVSGFIWFYFTDWSKKTRLVRRCA